MSPDLSHGLDFVHDAISRLLTDHAGSEHARPFVEVAQYALDAGGHRWRPLLILRIQELVGAGHADRSRLLSLGAAVEFLHSASLLLDDSRAMDNATLRRGRKCAHLVYGELRVLETALWLSDLSATITAELDASLPGISLSRRFHEVKTGMLHGQLMDVEDTATNEEALLEKSRLKSGVLYGYSCEAAALICGRADIAPHLRMFGQYMGVAYQISDDIHDMDSTVSISGKCSDQDLHKHTSPRTLGLERAATLRQVFKDKALAEAAQSGLNQDVLSGIVDLICI